MPELLAWLALLGVYDAPIDCANCAEWNRPQEPFQVFGNTWYVGTGGLGAVLIDTGDGLLLLDGGLPQSAAVIAANIEAAGFDVADIEFIGLSHAHYDHAGGLSALQRLSGAPVYAGEDAAEVLRRGELLPSDPQHGAGRTGQDFPAVAEAVGVTDGWTFSLGDVTIRAIATPGHTLGGTSWTWRSCEGGRCLDIVYLDSLSTAARPGYRFSDGLGELLDQTIARVANLDCDIMLSTHDFAFGLHEKLAAGRDAFIDAEACQTIAAKTGTYLDKRLQTEQR